MVDNELINAGELGFITAAIKEVAQTKVGDTILLANDKQTEPFWLQAKSAGSILWIISNKCC